MANLAGWVVVGAVYGAATVVALAVLWAVRHAAAELDTAEARPVAAAVLEQADEISVQATGAPWLCGLAEEVDATRIEEGISE